MLFIKTDLYYVFSNLVGVRNLYEESWSYIARFFRKVKEAEDSTPMYPEGDLGKIRLYSIIVLIFSLYSITVFSLYGVPIFSIIIVESIKIILTGPPFAVLLQYVFVLLFTGLPLLSFIYFILKALKSVRGLIK